MKKSILFFLILSFSQTLAAQNNDVISYGESTSKNGLYLDWGGRSDPSAVVGELGFMGYPSQHLSLRASFSFLAFENNEDTLFGANVGARYNFGNKISPFLGLGVFGGYASEDVSAENDNIDNDNDGSVDEDGEVETKTTDIMASIYPELGIHVWATDSIRMTLASKYHITTKGRNSDFQMYNFGFTFIFK